jgi:serine/threonine-protein kinase
VAFDKRARFATAEEMADELAAAVAPASREDVAAWVQRTAHDLLETRAQLVREAEAYDGEGDVMVVAPRDATGDGTAVLTTTEPPPRRRVGMRAGIAAIAVSALAVVAFVKLREPSAPAVDARAEGAAAAGTVSAGAGESASAPSATGATATLVLDPVVVPTGSSARTAAGAEVRPVAAKPKARAGQRPGGQASGASGARPGCDPPYSIDADGMKHYKASCLP